MATATGLILKIKHCYLLLYTVDAVHEFWIYFSTIVSNTMDLTNYFNITIIVAKLVSE